MTKDIQTYNTSSMTIKGVSITVNFAKERNLSAENSIGKILLKNIFMEGIGNETCKNSVS